MYFLHRVEIDPYRRRAAQPRSPARENFRRRVNHAFCSGIPLQRDTHTLRRLSHPACASAGIPVLFCRQPPPRPRLRRSSPAPRRGRGSARAYIRGAAVPGVSRWETVPGSSPGSPHAVDRGDIAIGGGADGEGELVPPPLSLTLQPSCFPSIPPQPLAGDPYTSPAPPPRPRLRRSSPASSWGRGPCPGVYQGSSRIRGGAGRLPCPALLRDLPVHWTVEDIAIGRGDLRGGGGDLPLSLTPSGPRTSCRPCPCLRRREPGFLPAIPAPGLAHTKTPPGICNG